MILKNIKNDFRICKSLENGENVPRKAKLWAIGRKLSKKKARNVIKEFVESDPDERHPAWAPCPKCGGISTHIVHHPVEYPEVFSEVFCLRYHALVAYQDNSPWYSIVELNN